MFTYPHKLHRWSLAFTVMGMITVLASTTLAEESTDDPLEIVNRPIYIANGILDQYLGEPISQVYIDYTPDPVRSTVSNFFDNVTYLNVVLNDFFARQG